MKHLNILQIAVFVLFMSLSSVDVLSITDDGKRAICNVVCDFIERHEQSDSKYYKYIAKLKDFNELTDSSFYSALDEYGYSLLSRGRQADGVNFFKDILPYFESETLTKSENNFVLDIYVRLGAAFEEIGMCNVAMDYYLKGLSKAKDCKSESRIAMLMNNIGVIYMDIGEINKAMEYFKSAEQLNLNLNNNMELYINYSNMANVSEEVGNYNDAMSYSLKALQYVDEKENSMRYWFMYVNIASLYSKQGNYQMSLDYLRRAKNELEKSEFTHVFTKCCIALSDVFLKLNELDSAQYYNKKVLDCALSLKNGEFMYGSYVREAEISAKDGSWQNSYKLLKKAIEINDSIFQSDNRLIMGEWEKIYGQNSFDRSSEKFNDLTSFLIIFAGIISVIYLIIYFRRFKRKIRLKNNCCLNEMKNEYESQTEILKRQIEEKQEQINSLNRQFTSKILTDSAYNVQIERVSDSLKKLLLTLNPRLKEERLKIKLLLEQLTDLNNSNNLEEFRYYFEKVNPVFYSSLEEKHPELTPKDKRMCAYIYLGLSSKEISLITDLEVRSVETSRMRLRKKLGLIKDINLTEYLQSL